MNLDFFIDYKKSDCDARSREAHGGVARTRRCPTADVYAADLRRCNIIPTDRVYGIYRRIFLRPLISPGIISLCKTWLGAPMVALRRVIHATSSFRSDAIPSQIREQLRTLLDLYCRPDPAGSSGLPTTPTSTSITEPGDDSNPSPPRKKPRLLQWDAACDHQNPPPNILSRSRIMLRPHAFSMDPWAERHN